MNVNMVIILEVNFQKYKVILNLIQDDAAIPGMGPEDKIEFTESLTADKGFIPGLDVDPNSTILTTDSKDSKKVPYSKPIPRNFQAHWNDTGKMDDDELPQRESENRDFNRAPSIEQPAPSLPQQPVPQPHQNVYGIVVYEKFVQVIPGSRLAQVIAQGNDSLNKFISAGEVEDINDLIPKEENKSPPVKKSRFEPIIDHKAEIIYSGTPEASHYQNLMLHQGLNNSNIPSLLGLKVSNPDSGPIELSDDERDWNGGRFNENDRNNPNNNNNVRSNGRSSRFSDNNNRNNNGSNNNGGAGNDSRRRRRRH